MSEGKCPKRMVIKNGKCQSKARPTSRAGSRRKRGNAIIKDFTIKKVNGSKSFVKDDTEMGIEEISITYKDQGPYRVRRTDQFGRVATYFRIQIRPKIQMNHCIGILTYFNEERTQLDTAKRLGWAEISEPEKYNPININPDMEIYLEFMVKFDDEDNPRLQTREKQVLLTPHYYFYIKVTYEGPKKEIWLEVIFQQGSRDIRVQKMNNPPVDSIDQIFDEEQEPLITAETGVNFEVPARPATMTQSPDTPPKTVSLTGTKARTRDESRALPLISTDEAKRRFQDLDEDQLIENVLVPLTISMGFREIDVFHPFGPGEKGRDIICLAPNRPTIFYLGFIAIKDKLTEGISGSGSVGKVWNQIDRAMVYEYRNKHGEIVRLQKVIVVAAGGVVKTKNPREYIITRFKDHFPGKEIEIWDDLDLTENILRYNSFEYPRIPEKPEYEPLIRIYDAIKSIINQGPPWQIYCYSKFAICYLLHMVFVQKDQGKNETLLGIFHLFDGFEHEEEDKNRLYIGEPFQRVNFEQVYNSLKPIWRALFRLGDANERFMAWFDIPLIREIMRDELFTNPIYNNKYTEDTLTDEELTQILTINSTYNTVIRHRLEDPQWLTRHHLEKASKQEKEDYLAKDIEDFRQKIPETVAMDMFKLSLKFCCEYLRKYNW